MRINSSRFLFLLISLFFISGIILLFLRDPFGLEIRAGIFVREMLSNGFFICPSLFGRPYFDYPPLFFIFESFFCHLCGKINAMCLALPSLISATFLIGTVYYFVKKFLGENTALISALILFATPEFWLKAQKATLDMQLALFCFLSLKSLYIYLDKKQQFFLFLGLLSLALAYFTKGVIAIVFIVFPLTLFLVIKLKKIDLLYILFSFIFLLLIFHFLILINFFDINFIFNILNAQIFSRIGTKVNRPFYYYWIYLIISFFPWILWYCYLSFKKLPKKFDNNQLKRNKFILFVKYVVVIGFLPFLFASSRHSRYLLPIFPFIAILFASYFSNYITLKSSTEKFSKLFVIINIIMFSITFLLTLFIEPTLSKKESGREFILATEKHLPQDASVYLYRLKRDGDGLKYAFYSKFYPNGLNFITTIDEIPKDNRKKIIVLFEKDLNRLKGIPHLTPIAHGLIHSKRVVSLCMCQKNESNIN